jgi:battenin
LCLKGKRERERAVIIFKPFQVILLADILPSFTMKLIAPYIMNFIPYWSVIETNNIPFHIPRIPYHIIYYSRIRILGTVGFSLASFLLVGLGNVTGLIIFGVACASLSSGFGEMTFLSFTARYDKSTVSGWSSGTGVS